MKRMMKNVMIYDTWVYYQTHTTVKYTELLKGYITVIVQKQKCLFSLIRGTRLDEILNTKMNTRK